YAGQIVNNAVIGVDRGRQLCGCVTYRGVTNLLPPTACSFVDWSTCPSTTIVRSGNTNIRRIQAEEIGENPCGAGNREGFGGFTPIRMIAGIGKKQWHPDEQAEGHEHQGRQASGEKRHAIRKKSQRRKCEEKSRGYGPKHRTWRKPLGNKTGGSVEIKRLFEGKGNGTDAQKNAAEAIKHVPRPWR